MVCYLKTATRALTTLLVACLLPLTSGCTLDASISCIGQTCSSSDAGPSSLVLDSEFKTISGSNETKLLISGGTPPYELTLISGPGSIDTANQKFIASGIAGKAVIQVKDSENRLSEIEIDIKENLAFIANQMSWAQGQGITYDFNNLLKGGVPPFTYSLDSGPGTLDSALGLFSLGFNWGTSTVRVTDSLSNSAQIEIKNRPTVLNGEVNAMLSYNSYLYLGGSFTAINPMDTAGFAAVDGTTGDLTPLACNWHKKLVGTIETILVDGDAIYLGGLISSFDGVSVSNLIKINNTTCDLDVSFASAAKPNSRVRGLAVDGNDLFAVGGFSTFDGVSVGRIVKLNKITGEKDATFNSGLGFQEGSNEVNDVAIHGNSVYATGWFGTYNGTAAQNLAKLDKVTGALDTTFTQATGLSNKGDTLVIANNALYVGGSFANYRGTFARGVAKLDLTTGALDTTFNQATGFSSSAFKIVASKDSLYVLGQFYDYRSVSVERLAKIDLVSGDLDTTFSQPTGFTNTYSAMAVLGDSLYIGGPDSYRGQTVNGLIKVDLETGALDTQFSGSTATGGGVSTLASAGTTLYVGGSFSGYRGARANGIVKINKTTGEIDQTFSNNANVGLVYDLTIVGTSLYAAGGTGGITKLDLETGVIDPDFVQGTGFNPSTATKTLASDSTSIYVGGTIASYNGITVGKIAKLDADTGVLDATFPTGTGFNLGVNKILLDSGSLYVAGAFTTYGGSNAYRLAKLDSSTGALDTTFTQATGFNAGVNALTIEGDNLYVAGTYSTYRGTSNSTISKLHKASGVLDTTFSQATGLGGGTITPQSIVLSNSALYVGGAFYSYRGVQRPKIVKLNLTNGDLDTSFSDSVGFDEQVNSLLADGNFIFAGGKFKHFKSEPARYFIRLNKDSSNLE